jgi:hypothetical protein
MVRRGGEASRSDCGVSRGVEISLSMLFAKYEIAKYNSLKRRWKYGKER